MRRRRNALIAVALVALAACSTEPTPTARPSPSLAPPASVVPSAPPSPVVTQEPTATVTPSATPEPALSLALPADADERIVSIDITPEVAADGGGRITAIVTNRSDTRIDEIVLRWPTDLAEALFLAPFEPSAERIREGGDPLVQPWTKWVVGPGERGEPDQTTSLGYGPMDPGMTLSIPLYVTRNAPGPVAFDLQILAGEAILTLEGGTPAELRIEVP